MNFIRFFLSVASVVFVFSPAHGAPNSCTDAFSSIGVFRAQATLFGLTHYSETDFKLMASLSEQLRLPPQSYFTRIQQLKRFTEVEVAMGVAQGEIIRLAAATLKFPVELVESHLSTLLNFVTPRTLGGAGGRRLSVPHRIHSRLAVLAFLTGESPGETAIRYNDSFQKAAETPPQSEEELLLASSPYDFALNLTVDEALSSSPKAQQDWALLFR